MWAKTEDGAIVIPSIPPNTKLYVEEFEEISWNEFTGEWRIRKGKGLSMEKHEMEFREFSSI